MVALASGFFGPSAKPAVARQNENDYPLGSWSNNKFSFNSPQAEEQWRRDAVQNGVHFQSWDQGRKLNEKQRQLAELGFAQSDDIYRGPDGEYYQTTPASQEAPEVTAMRAASLQQDKSRDLGETMRRVTTNITPDALATMAQKAPIAGLKPSTLVATSPSANDNTPAASDNRPSSNVWTGLAPKNVAELAALGRSGHITAAQSQAAIDDSRLLLSGATAGYSNNAIAAAQATSAVLTGGFHEIYQEKSAAQNAETEAARKREGVAGAVIEAAPTFVPGYGDAVGLADDLKMYRDDPSSRTFTHYIMTAAGLLPFIPSVASKVRRLDYALEAGTDIAGAATREGEHAASTVGELGHDWDRVVLDAASNPFTESEARKLDGEHKGLIYVREEALKDGLAKLHQDGVNGAVYLSEGWTAAPALRYVNGNERGRHFIKFDGVEKAADGKGLLLIDAKTKLAAWTPRQQNYLNSTFRRIQSALAQNPDFRVVYEFPDEKAMLEARRFIEGNGFQDIIGVRVRRMQ
jgi:hypothetical protein